MSLSQIFKKVLIPCAASVTAKDGHTHGPNCDKAAEPGKRPSDLPIYSKECSICRETTANKSLVPASGIEEAVGNLRKELWVWQDNLKGYRHKIVDVYNSGYSKADSAIEYLRQPPNTPHRMGAIALSGLTGYVLGMRRGKIRRLLYGTFGVMGMAAICYPEEAKDYLESIVLEGRRCFIIAYHFICGETPQLPEWLEKFVGPLGQKGTEGESIETSSESKKKVSEETKPTTEKKS